MLMIEDGRLVGPWFCDFRGGEGVRLLFWS